MLKHSIHLASVHGPKGGRYDYQLYAIYHPSAAACVTPLKELGYTLLERETPVAVKDIQGEFPDPKSQNRQDRFLRWYNC